MLPPRLDHLRKVFLRPLTSSLQRLRECVSECGQSVGNVARRFRMYCPTDEPVTLHSSQRFGEDFRRNVPHRDLYLGEPPGPTEEAEDDLSIPFTAYLHRRTNRPARGE